MSDLDYHQLRDWCAFKIPFEQLDQENSGISLEMQEWLNTSCRDQWILENTFDRIYEKTGSKIVFSCCVYFKNDEDALIYCLFWP